MTMAQRTIKTRPWDSAEHLRTEADIAAYLDACLEEAGDDPAFITHALGVVARSRGMTQLARETDDPRRAVQGAFRGRQSELRDRAEGHPGARHPAARRADLMAGGPGGVPVSA